MSFLEHNPQINAKDLGQEFASTQPIGFSSIILHNTSGKNALVTKKVQPGVYTLVNDELIFIRQSINASDIESEDQFLITEGIPLLGTTVIPDVLVCKIQFRSSVTGDGFSLYPNVAKIAKTVFQQFGFVTENHQTIKNR